MANAQYYKVELPNKKWVICESGHDYRQPQKAITFAFDTETLVYLDGKIESQETMLKKLKGVKDNEKRKRVKNEVWAWQIYDELNGFFMTNDFYIFIDYICKAGFKYGWCYNSTFDFAQIDYEILAKGKDKRKPHETRTGKAYNKAQAWTYNSIHNDAGARYCYKLRCPYKQLKDRHVYTHAFDLRDFMKLVAGGLKKLLNDLDVRDNDGNPIRKLEMDYQNVKQDNLTQEEIAYCCNDVKGLYFAIKQFNETIEAQSNNELHIYGEDTNLMTAGGFAKAELLRSMYPNFKNKRKRLAAYQREHPLTIEQDAFIRNNHLYRGGISLVNERFKGRLTTKEQMGDFMYRYDVNSEYPYAMASIRDLIGRPKVMSLEDWENMQNKEDYEAIYILNEVIGKLKAGMVGFWYDPFRRCYTDYVEETGRHLMFERELYEMANWYDLEFSTEAVLVYRRGGYAYKPFIQENYELKAQAKRDGNKTLQQTTKLKLNSSYGKLAERIERRTGHYELNEETGAIHFIEDTIERDEKSAMNVVIGALVTSYARCYILSKIREVCGNGQVSKYFVYIDTDSIHAFKPYSKADAYKLGGLKLEVKCEAIKYIAPKTYVDITSIEALKELKNINDTKEFLKHFCNNVEIHSKGISLAAVLKVFLKQKDITLSFIDKQISYGVQYVVLCAMNVVGGKVLLPTEKYLARVELAPKGLYINNLDTSYLNER